jgi:hypothetical protein
VARELSYKRLDHVTCLSGHGGRFRPRPTREEFQLIDQSIKQNGGSWEAFWCSYLLLRMHQENRFQQFINGNRGEKFNPLRSILNRVPRDVDKWQIGYTQVLAEMAKNAELNLLAKDAIDDINRQLQKNGQVLWFLYDDLDAYQLLKHLFSGVPCVAFLSPVPIFLW